MAVVRLLAKLEGNLKDIEYGEAGENAIWDLREFAELFKNVVIPHFKDEEKIVYPKASTVDEDGHEFIEGMYDEHTALYEAFEGLKEHIEKEETKVAELIKKANELERG